MLEKKGRGKKEANSKEAWVFRDRVINFGRGRGGGVWREGEDHIVSREGKKGGGGQSSPTEYKVGL